MKSTIRLNKALQNVLAPYGEEGGVAIRNMKVRIDDLEKVLALFHAADAARSEEKKHWTNTGPVGGHDGEFWSKMEEVVTKSLQSRKAFVTESLPYVAKSNTPVKTFGKIEDSDKLVEPVGKQGREIR
jgi:hypothetical protein